MKCLDGIANPYLAVSAILAAGILGIQSSTKLDMKPCQGQFFVLVANLLGESHKLSEIDREEMGITRKFPESVLQALSFLSQDELLRETLGEKFALSYLSVKEVYLHLVLLISD